MYGACTYAELSKYPPGSRVMCCTVEEAVAQYNIGNPAPISEEMVWRYQFAKGYDPLFAVVNPAQTCLRARLYDLYMKYNRRQCSSGDVAAKSDGSAPFVYGSILDYRNKCGHRALLKTEIEKWRNIACELGLDAEITFAHIEFSNSARIEPFLVAQAIRKFHTFGQPYCISKQIEILQFSLNELKKRTKPHRTIAKLARDYIKSDFCWLSGLGRYSNVGKYDHKLKRQKTFDGPLNDFCSEVFALNGLHASEHLVRGR